MITHRYLDEDQAFFAFAERYYKDVVVTSDQLSLWEHSPDSTEAWLLETVEEWKKPWQDLRKKVEVAREKLGKRF